MRESGLTRANQRSLPTSRRLGLGIMAMFGIVSLFAAACTSPAGSKAAGQAGAAAGAPSASPAAQVTITPANGTSNAKPNKGISITATAGKITNVAVTTGHQVVGGVLATDAKSWHTNWSLHTGAHYKVTVSAINAANKITTTTSSFRTLAAGATFSAITAEGLNQTYGVGMPIMISFSSPVTRKAAVEKAIQIKTSKPVVGAWVWNDDEDLAFRPQTYWPAHTKVSFTGHFNGLAIAPGVYGTSNLSQSFRIGNSLIGVTSTVTHKTRIYWKGKLYATWPDSTGMPGDDTSNGTYLTIEKGNPVLMSGPGYKNVPGVLVGPVHLERRLLPLRALVGGGAGVRQRQPRLREPGSQQRPVVLRAGRSRRPDHHHRQPGRRPAGRRLHRVVLHVESAAEPQRHRTWPCRPGRPAAPWSTRPRCRPRRKPRS